MSKQRRFQARDYATDPDYKLLDAKFRKAKDLEYAVMLGHVMVEDQLITLLAARLGADTMPTVRGFDLIAGLAFAGSKRKHLRDAAELLNGARNEVGHKMQRTTFPRGVEHFVRAVKGQSGKTMTWPRGQAKRVDQLRLAIRFFMAELAFAIEYEEKLRQKT